jgi:hypothetical protein
MSNRKSGASSRPSQALPAFGLFCGPNDRPPSLTLLDWREIRKETLCGFATVRINAVATFQSSPSAAARPSGRAYPASP